MSCRCNRPTVARCSWKMHTVALADDHREATLTDGDGALYKRVYSGETCGLELCEDHDSVVDGRHLCLWHFVRGKEQGVVPVAAPAAPAWRERLAKEQLQLLLAAGGAS